jgi:hypothetical protein
MAFHSFNDLIRNKKENEITNDMPELYIDNLNSLLYVLSEDDPNELFTVIEINRQLCRFEKCKEFQDRIDDPNESMIKSLFLKEVENKSSRLFVLNLS